MTAGPPVAPPVIKADDLTIPGDDMLYRRVPRIPMEHMVLVDETDGSIVFSRGAFKFNKNDGRSVYRHSILQDNSFTWEDAKNAPDNGVASVTVLDVREVNLGIADDPHPPLPLVLQKPRDVAHAVIVHAASGPLSNSKREQALTALAKRAQSVGPA